MARNVTCGGVVQVGGEVALHDDVPLADGNVSHEPFSASLTGVSSISSAHLHARPTGGASHVQMS